MGRTPTPSANNLLQVQRGSRLASTWSALLMEACGHAHTTATATMTAAAVVSGDADGQVGQGDGARWGRRGRNLQDWRPVARDFGIDTSRSIFIVSDRTALWTCTAFVSDGSGLSVLFT